MVKNTVTFKILSFKILVYFRAAGRARVDAADLRRLCPGRLVVRGTLGSWGAAGRARVDAADLRRLCPGRLVVRGELGTLGLWPAREPKTVQYM